MGQNTVINQFGPNPRLDAAIHAEKWLLSVFPVTLAASLAVAKGNLLIPGSLTATNDVQTISFSGSPTGGTFTLKGTNPVTGAPFETAAITYATSSTGDTNIQNALVAALNEGSNVLAVSSLVVTWGGLAAGQPVLPLSLGTNGLTGGSSPSLSVAHTTPGVTAGAYTVYAGSGTPTCLLQYDVATDATGLATFGAGSTGGIWGQKSPNVPAYFAGEFYGADIPNLDSAAVTALKGRFISGALGVAGAIFSF